MDEYNWSNLDVGDQDLNHSEGFFAFTHSKHEKFYKEPQVLDDKENRLNQAITHKLPDSVIILKEISDIKKDIDINKNILNNKNSNNLLTAVQKRINNKIYLTSQQPPSVYKYKDIYENKKKRLFNKIMEDEKKKREFHSRPAPKFKFSELPEVKEIKLTCPTTPGVLKKSIQHLVEKRHKFKEELRKQQEKQQIKNPVRDAKVLHEEPFVPKKQPHSIDMQPFNLNVEKRLKNRKQYDESNYARMANKKKLLEEEQKLRDQILSKEMRKLATFKANPNPFRNE